jgi:hypothetical protein
MTAVAPWDTHITVIADPIHRGAFRVLLQEGVALRIQTGVAVRTFLCDRLGLDPSYVSEQITTVFLNCTPVDDIDHTLIRDSDRLSLSGALPGLAGALMRRSSVLAPLRGPCSDRRAPAPEAGREGTLWIKLFNTVLDDLGPLILRQGVLVRPERLKEIVCPPGGGPFQASVKVILNGASVGPETLVRALSSHEGLVSLAVLTETMRTDSIY